MAKKRKSLVPQPSQASVEEPQLPIEEPQQHEEDQTANDTATKDPKVEQEEDLESDEEEEEQNDAVAEYSLEEPIGNLLNPFSKEQLVLLLKEAVSKYPDFIENVNKIADSDPAHRNVFVHGLGWDTTSEMLTSEFAKYGEMEDCKVVVDKVSGKSKGYAFILYKHRSGAKKALKEPQKKIGSRMASCQLASAGPGPGPGQVPPPDAPVSEFTQRKIFVSNVSPDIDPQKLLEFFSKFGEVEDGPLGLDKQTGKPKGFAFFVYKSVESAKNALKEPHKSFEGVTLHCQKAIDGPKPNKQQNQNPNQHYGGYNPSKRTKYGGGQGHMMAPSGPNAGYNPAVSNPALTPVLGQALAALLATQGANLLGGLGGAPVNAQGMQPGMNNSGYGNQGGASYGAQGGLQGAYPNPQMGQGGSRPQQGGASYMGQGH